MDVYLCTVSVLPPAQQEHAPTLETSSQRKPEASLHQQQHASGFPVSPTRLLASTLPHPHIYPRPTVALHPPQTARAAQIPLKTIPPHLPFRKGQGIRMERISFAQPHPPTSLPFTNQVFPISTHCIDNVKSIKRHTSYQLICAVSSNPWEPHHRQARSPRKTQCTAWGSAVLFIATCSALHLPSHRTAFWGASASADDGTPPHHRCHRLHRFPRIPHPQIIRSVKSMKSMGDKSRWRRT